MTEAELLQVIEKAARDGVTKLDLRFNQLSSLPAEIGQLTNLKILRLRGNPLPIPPEILDRPKPGDVKKILNFYFLLQ
ncbi:leucine-rich repeat domain-containing protein [Sphaerospermopsis aphanizomenoides BCCUSP55]|uniref:leucine-rich repeat domain-containing protein n=1 Tax=Sphaerospermopsis aphanizomenoides TaxID=459663 RepID=UPI001905E395|nr:leucine-rich repeat domain-containing protein [Sphaerospermopsis aphanizomenoides]MBK1986750.1 leucine-rich repeat domain-containing protein [Sphaerospermopsis aphanizomenoides BCCUSP55]